MHPHLSSKKLYFAKFRILQLFQESWVSAVRRVLVTLQLLTIPQGIITIAKFIYLKINLRKTACKAIISDICILRNFALYNFC